MTSSIDKQEDDGLTAAEYVIGVLPSEKRREVEERMQRDEDFNKKIIFWETQLASLNESYGTVQPPKHIKTAIDAALFGQPKRRWHRWASRGFWLSGAIVTTLLLVVWIELGFEPSKTQLIAELRGENPNTAFSIVVEENTFSIVQAEASIAADRDFELWLLASDGAAPQSLGVFKVEDQLEIPNSLDFGEGVTLAVSVEPKGGSPTGQPTGPVISVGVLERSQS